MKYEFLVLYDKLTNFAAPGYNDKEISLFLNKAQERILKTNYNYKGNKYLEGFEETEKRRKDLSELVRGPKDNTGNLVTKKSVNQNGTLANGVFFDIPEDVLYVIYEEAKITSSDSCLNNTIISVIPVTHDTYTSNKHNPFKQPDRDEVWRLDFSREVVETGNKRHELITDGTYDISEYLIRYIKKPREIVVDETTPANQINSEFDSGKHREIVDKAVQIALETTQEPRWQTFKVESHESE